MQKYDELMDLDICSPVFNFKRATHTIMEHSERLICDVILDQLVLPGVGNIIKNEVSIIKMNVLNGVILNNFMENLVPKWLNTVHYMS